MRIEPRTWIGTLRGHRWTLGPFLGGALRPIPPPAAEHFQITAIDRRVGDVRLTGRLRKGRGRRGLVVLVHGLGGHAASGYMIDMACAAERANVDSLRLNLRGADRSGTDFYHAGLTEDLHTVLRSEALSHYETVAIVGFSLGGHMVLRFATEQVDARVRGIATLCSPLDLDRCATAIDAPERRMYLWHVLRGLKEMYRSVARSSPRSLCFDEAERIQTIREWDGRIVAPRYGFLSAEDYYARMNVAQVLDRVAVPALVVHARFDPMVPAETVRPALVRASDQVRTVWIEDGGHLGFPSRTGRVEDQVISWFAGIEHRAGDDRVQAPTEGARRTPVSLRS